MIPTELLPSGAQGQKAKTFVYVLVALLVIVLAIYIVKRFFGGFDSVLEALHLKDDPDTAANKQKVKDAIGSSADTMNPFNPQMYKGAPSNNKFPTEQQVNDIANQIYDSVGIFWDSPEQGLSAIKQLPNQASVSLISDAFNGKFNVDLLDWLKQKYDTRDQIDTLSQIIAYVNNLPKYS